MSLKDYHDAVSDFRSTYGKVRDLRERQERHATTRPRAPVEDKLNADRGRWIQKKIEEAILREEAKKRFGKYAASESQMKVLRTQLQARIRKAVIEAMRDAKTSDEGPKSKYRASLVRWGEVEDDLKLHESQLNAELASARELVKLFFDEEVWSSLPVLDPTGMASDEGFFYRGTLGRRLIFDQTSNPPGLVDMDSFTGGDFVEFSPDIKVALTYARSGYPSDIGEDQRWDPVLVVTRLSREALHRGYGTFVAPKLSIGVQDLVDHCNSQVFRVTRS